MTTPKDVLISGDRHLIVLGQFGNLQAKILQLEHMINEFPARELLTFLDEIQVELGYLTKVYPQLDGSFHAVAGREQPGAGTSVPEPINGLRQKHKLNNALADMRVLMDAAALSFQHEGDISCHLKVMLDEAWGKAVEVVGLNNRDGIPF